MKLVKASAGRYDGEIAEGKILGYASNAAMIWKPCPKCGKYKWNSLHYFNKKGAQVCLSCAQKSKMKRIHGKIKAQSPQETAEPTTPASTNITAPELARALLDGYADMKQRLAKALEAARNYDGLLGEAADKVDELLAKVKAKDKEIESLKQVLECNIGIHTTIHDEAVELIKDI